MRELDRRDFLKLSGASGLTLAGCLAGCRRDAIPDPTAPRAASPVLAPGERALLASCPHCGVGCALHLRAEGLTILGTVPDQQSSVNRGALCARGLSAFAGGGRERLRRCLVRRDLSDPLSGRGAASKGQKGPEVWQEVSYAEALRLTSEKLAAIVKAHGGDAVGMLAGGPLPLEAHYVKGRLMREVLGSTAVEVNGCEPASAAAHLEAFGAAAPCATYEDVEQADLLCVFGATAPEAYPVLFWRALDHKKRTGIPTFVAEPRRGRAGEAFAAVDPASSMRLEADGGAARFLGYVAYLMVTLHEDVIAKPWLAAHVEGFAEYVAALDERYSPAKSGRQGGIDVALATRVAAEWAAATRKAAARGRGGVVSLWCDGDLCAAAPGSALATAILDLHLLTGNLGRVGAGPLWIGARADDFAAQLAGGEHGRLPFYAGLEAGGDGCKPGPKTPSLLERVGQTQVKGLWLTGATAVTGMASARHPWPPPAATFVVASAGYEDSPELDYADVVFPAALWGEWPGGVLVNAERRLMVADGLGSSPASTDAGAAGAAAPAADCRPELDLFIDMGLALATLLAKDGAKLFPYPRRANGYDPEAVFRDLLQASKGSVADLSGLLAVERDGGRSPYAQLRYLRGVQWPAPTAAAALQGGSKRRYMLQETAWPDRPYGAFPRAGGKALLRMCD
ncbi:MAG: molybdopterin-dependent oxidoreductase [Deltaproteobacteria bacterium]|nr:molybdopterin-dependent oxidoreductase [Deltaproteobacteria bacterium]